MKGKEDGCGIKEIFLKLQLIILNTNGFRLPERMNRAFYVLPVVGLPMRDSVKTMKTGLIYVEISQIKPYISAGGDCLPVVGI